MRRKILAAAVLLASLWLAGCREEIGEEDCEGAETYGSKGKDPDGSWWLNVNCENGTTYVIKWPAEGITAPGPEGPTEWQEADRGEPVK